MRIRLSSSVNYKILQVSHLLLLDAQPVAGLDDGVRARDFDANVTNEIIDGDSFGVETDRILLPQFGGDLLENRV